MSHLSFSIRRAPLHLALVAIAAVAAANCAPRMAASAPSHAGAPAAAVDYGGIPLGFVANGGQSDPEVQFLARGPGYGIFLTRSEAVLALRGAGNAVLRMRLVGARPTPFISGHDRLAGSYNYFIGDDRARWQRDIPTYGRVKYTGVYPGIDVVYYGNQRNLEYDIVVAPHADPAQVVLGFEGASQVGLDEQGNLVLDTANGRVVQHQPVIYQMVDGGRESVMGAYALGPDDTVGIRVGRYDPTRVLVIDPVVSYATYLGGTGNDAGNAIAVDSSGNAYVTGQTRSTAFPGASGSPIQSTQHGSDDVFVTKYNAAGSAILYSTYLGGSGGDYGYAIAVDGTGAAYVTGQTDSPTIAGPGNLPFPRAGAFQQSYNGGGGDVFVTKLNPAGNALVYSTYLGGSGVERGYGIAVDGSGSAYVTGYTNSVFGPGTFPVVNPLQADNGGSYDAFVTKFSAAGNGLIYSTYLGGTASEFSIDGGAIAVDSSGNAYVGGTTASAGFPGTATSPIQSVYGGGFNDGYVAKINASGTALVYSTFLGGNAYDAVNGLAVDASGGVVAAGYTDSPNFPVASALQPTRAGTSGNDAFVSRLNATGTAFVYSTYLGGSGGEVAYSVAIDSAGRAHVAGWTNSSNFPTAVPIQPAYSGAGDAFVSTLDASGAALVFSSYFGGSNGFDHAYGIAVDAAGSAYVTGKTNATNFPTVTPLQPTFGGSGEDAFVAKFIGDPPVVGAPVNLVVTSVQGSLVTVVWTAPGGGIAPTGYVLEGGVSPGEVLASLPTNSTLTSFTFSAPSGAFYIRMHSLAPGLKSGPSNESRLFVNVPAPPSAPVNLLGLVDGNSLALAWTNTAAGGPPTALTFDVSGSANLALGIPVSESFTLANVAPGTYNVSVRASNALGSSGSSNTVTLTFPGPCSGTPGVPTNLIATKNGSLISASWGLPAGGIAPTSYRVVVTGAFTGEIALTARTITGAVGAGSYTLSIVAVNACGSGPATPPQTVIVP